MSTTPDILCIGSVLWDVIGRASAKMQVGSDVPGRISRVPGGVAMNIAMALRAYGMRPALLSCIGKDPAGEALIQTCGDLGMITDHIYRAPDLPTDSYMAIEARNGLVAAVADVQSLETAGVRILAPFLNGDLADWTGTVALDGNLTHGLLAKIARSPSFAEADLRIAPASPSKADRLAPFLSHHAATLYANLEEAERLLDTRFDGSAAAARALVKGGLYRAIVTDGPRATTLATATELHSQIPPRVSIARVTGAGDTFMATHIACENTGFDGKVALDEALDATAIYISGVST